MAAKGRKQGTKKDTPAKKRGAVGKPCTPKKKNSGGRRRETQEESSGLEKAREEGFELVKTAGDGEWHTNFLRLTSIVGQYARRTHCCVSRPHVHGAMHMSWFRIFLFFFPLSSHLLLEPH